MISGPVVGREGGNKCTGGDEVHTLRLILNNFLIAGAQLFHLDGNLYHSTDMVNINIKLIFISIQTSRCFLLQEMFFL